ncbi:MAG: hypothetical protein L3J47_12465 [Sulfurovum sp.]|nr:hypothetical protein [Sulfurovum sp.]
MTYQTLLLTETLYVEEVSSLSERAFLADEVFAVLKEAYADVAGGLHYKDADTLLQKSSLWKVIYYGTTIVGVVIYRQKKGLKMVALGLSKTQKHLAKHSKRLLAYLFKMAFRCTWMEVSEAAERFIVKVGGERYFVANTMAAQLTGKEIVALCDDGYHYTRYINGVLKTKVIVGHPLF